MTNWAWQQIDKSLPYAKYLPEVNQRMKRLEGVVNEKQRKIVVDLRDFGDVGSGQHDDTSSLTKAIKQTPSNAILQFYPATFLTTSLALTGMSKVTIWGHGADISNVSGTSAANIFNLTNCTDLTIDGFGELDGGYTGVSTGSNPVIQLGTGGVSGQLNENIHIRNLRIKNGNHACITAFGETDTGVEGNRNVFLHNLTLSRAGAGIFIYKGMKGLFVSDVRVTGVGANGMVMDTRAATDTNTTGSYPISHVRVDGLRVLDIVADAGFEPRAVVIKGACKDIRVDGLDVSTITANDSSARNTYGVLIAQSAAPGTGATATATLTGTSVTSFTVTAGGSGYTTPPTVFISSGSGSGATGTAVLTSGAVTSITVDSGGENYAEAPYVQLIAGEVGEDIQILNTNMENINDLGGTTGWPVYVQSGFRDVQIKAIRTKNCKRGINVDAADCVHIEDVIYRDGPNQAATFPVQISGVSTAAPATNIKIGKVTAVRGSGSSSATHAISVNFADNARISQDCSQLGYDTGLMSISTVNALRVSGCVGSATVDPANLADGGGTTLGVTCNGARVGDFAEAGFSNSLQGITMTAYVSANNTVQCRFQNETGGAIDLASGTLSVRTTRP